MKASLELKVKLLDMADVRALFDEYAAILNEAIDTVPAWERPGLRERVRVLLDRVNRRRP